MQLRSIDDTGRRTLLLLGTAGMSLGWLCVYCAYALDFSSVRISNSTNTAPTNGYNSSYSYSHNLHSNINDNLNRIIDGTYYSRSAAADASLFVSSGWRRMLLCVGLGVVVASYYTGVGGVSWVYAAEIFPFRARAKLTALTTCMRFVCGMCWATVWKRGLLTSRRLLVLGALTLSVCALVSGLVVYAVVPETRQLMLEDMEELFRVDNSAFCCGCWPACWQHNLYLHPHPNAHHHTLQQVQSQAPAQVSCWQHLQLSWRALLGLRCVAPHSFSRHLALQQQLQQQLHSLHNHHPQHHNHSSSFANISSSALATGTSHASASATLSQGSAYHLLTSSLFSPPTYLPAATSATASNHQLQHFPSSSSYTSFSAANSNNNYYQQSALHAADNISSSSGDRRAREVIAQDSDLLLDDVVYEPRQLHKYSLEMSETRFKTVKLLPQLKHGPKSHPHNAPVSINASDRRQKVNDVQDALPSFELISSRMPADQVSGRSYGALSHASTGATRHNLLYDLQEADEEVGRGGQVDHVYRYGSDKMDEGEVEEEDEEEDEEDPMEVHDFLSSSHILHSNHHNRPEIQQRQGSNL